MGFELLVSPHSTVRIPLRKIPIQKSPSPTSLNLHLPRYSSASHFQNANFPSNLCLATSGIKHYRFIPACVNRTQELIDDVSGISTENGDEIEQDFEEQEEKRDVARKIEKMELGSQTIWDQMKEIVLFTGPATALWICGPLMSLIDTVVIGHGSSLELAALGPATVVCDYMSYVFMFLSIATSNMVATALARQDREELQHHISVLLFVGLVCGFIMLLFTKFLGAATLTAHIGRKTRTANPMTDEFAIFTAFTGPKNAHVVPAANNYVQIRGLAWPALLVGWVAQSASLGMKDSLGPLKALAAASFLNIIGAIVLCRVLGYGITGAAWATLVSQVVAGYMMIQNLDKKGFNAYAFSIPSGKEILTILGLAAPVFITMISKVSFYALLIYFATSMGTHTMAAHQVMVQTFCMCTVWGEPLSQTAQSFMPELIFGVNRSLAKARLLLRSLLIIGAMLGLLLGIVGTSVPWLFPNIYTPDQMIIREMHKVLIPYFIALSVTPPALSLEGTLLAGRDLRYLSLSMSGCFSLGAVVLWFLSSRYGLQGCWFALAGFQWLRFSMALQRVLSPSGMFYSEEFSQYKLQKLSTA